MKKNSLNFLRVPARIATTLLLAGGLGACASSGGNPQDPWESMNRATFRFNDMADRAVMRPVAEAYDTVAPLPIKTGVSNVFGNVADLWIGVNNLLQGKVLDGLSDGGRFLINTTVGMLGVFDIATELGLDKHDEDFGQTLGAWGVGSGPYLVLPFLGPSTLRDGTSLLLVDLNMDPVWQIDDMGQRNRTTALRLVAKRAQLLGADTAAEQAALDKYGYMRSFYLQYRQNQVYDGSPPRVKDPDDDAALDMPAAAVPPLAAAPSEQRENQE